MSTQHKDQSSPKYGGYDKLYINGRGVTGRSSDVVEVIVKARKAEIVDWLIRESGSVRIEAEIEWQAVVDIIEQATAALYRVIGHIMPSNISGKKCRVYKNPLGVIAVISPWDFAVHLSNRSVAPADSPNRLIEAHCATGCLMMSRTGVT